MAMGFHPTVRIVKSRRTATLDGMTLCVDEVEHAGAFMEIERTVRGDQSGAVLAQAAEPARVAAHLGLRRCPWS
jgi:adenylate cyclase class 2